MSEPADGLKVSLTLRVKRELWLKVIRTKKHWKMLNQQSVFTLRPSGKMSRFYLAYDLHSSRISREDFLKAYEKS